MGLAWQQGPLAGGAVGHFLSADPVPSRMFFVEPLRRRMRVRFSGQWIADSENVLLLHEPGRYPVALFPVADVPEGVLVDEGRRTWHQDLDRTAWYSVQAAGVRAKHAAWQYPEPPAYAAELVGRVAFAWRAMDGFYEEDERIVGHAADLYHRNDIRQSSRHLVVRSGGRTIADTVRPRVLYESGFAPRWYVPREDIEESALTRVPAQTFCPYKGLASYYDIDDQHGAAWYYPDAWREVDRIADWVSFEAHKVEVYLDDQRQHVEPGQQVSPHGVDRGLDTDEVLDTRSTHAEREGTAR